MRVFIFLPLIFLWLASSPSSLAATHEDLCQGAAKKAERQFAIPDGLLQAIALVESGQTIDGSRTAWPWTVNTGGNGHYFPTRREAEAFVRRSLRAGRSSIDIGCFQINTKWHGKNFGSVTKMFDPDGGAAYAASFLTKLKNEFGDWRTAVRTYHSRTRKYGDKYGSKIHAAMQALEKSVENTERTGAELHSSRFSRQQPENVQAFGGVELLILLTASPLLPTTGVAPFILDDQ